MSDDVVDDISSMRDADLVHADHALVREVIRLRSCVRSAIKDFDDSCSDEAWWFKDRLPEVPSAR